MDKNPFDYQKPSDEEVKAIEAVRGMAKMLHAGILTVTPSSRERALAIQKLEEFSMWANKAIVFNGAQNVGGAVPMQNDFGTKGIDPEHKDDLPTINLEDHGGKN